MAGQPFEKATHESILRHMDDDPCAICGENGHDAWVCRQANSPLSLKSPLPKIFGQLKATAVRKHMLDIRKKQKKPERALDSVGAAQPECKGGETVTSGSALASEETQESSAGPSVVAVRRPQHLSVEQSPAVGASSSNAQTAPPDVGNLKNVRDMVQHEQVDIVAPPNAEVPNLRFGKGNEYEGKLTISKDPKGQARFPPLRKEFAKSFKPTYTNHYEVKFKPGTRIFVYEILGIPAGSSKRKAKLLLKTAIEAWDFLQNNKEHFATDNIKTIVAWKDIHSEIAAPRVLGGREESPIGDEWRPNPIADGVDRVELTIKLQRELDLQGLQAYINPSNDASDPNFEFSPIVNALNIIMTSNLTADVFQQSTNKFFVKSGYKPLTGGSANLKTLCTMRGYYYTIKPGMQMVLLNVNVATSAFFRDISLAEYLKDETFTEEERTRLLKFLKLYIVHDRKNTGGREDQERIARLNQPQNRIKRFCELGPELSNKNMTFKKFVKTGNGELVESSESIHVTKHLHETFGKTFKEYLKAVNVGTPGNPVYYPREYLRILPNQIYKRLLPDNLVSEMLDHASHPPGNSSKMIEVEGIRSFGLDQHSPGMQGLSHCPNILVRPTMLKILSANMPPLEIMYGQAKSRIELRHGVAQWNLKDCKHFLRTPEPEKPFNYILFVERGMEDHATTVQLYINAFESAVRQHNVRSRAQCVSTVALPAFRSDPSKLYDAKQSFIKEIKNKTNSSMALLLINKASVPIYSAFKDVTDRIAPIHSICVTRQPNVKDGRLNQGKMRPYMSNVMMKANLKFRGENHTVKTSGKPNSDLRGVLKDTLVLGADVTHPSPNSLEGCPSIAAVVGSVGPNATTYLGSMRVQTSKQEIINDLSDMVSQRLIDYQASNSSKPPTSILFFRDGVSTSQFATILDLELPRIKSAFEKTCPDHNPPKITLILTVKRHNTRFYTADDITKNCKPGTLVDTAVTSPHHMDFFLQSHHAIQGTAIPTHYIVLANEMGLSDAQIQEITWKMCYTYVRATVGVSYAPPAYYADRLCERGRVYLREFFAPDGQGDKGKRWDERKKEIEEDVKKGKGKGKGRTDDGGMEMERDWEREWRKSVKEKLDKEVLEEAKKEFGKHRKDGPGPWAEMHDGVMFWM